MACVRAVREPPSLDITAVAIRENYGAAGRAITPRNNRPYESDARFAICESQRRSAPMVVGSPWPG
jgi:hypothetical protein